jgi:hypothetical protein
MTNLCKYQFDLNPADFQVLEVFQGSETMRYGFRTFNQREVQATGSVHNYEKMELKPINWKVGQPTIVCNVPHEGHFITQWKEFCFHSRMKDYGNQASKTGLHIPQALINAIENTPTAATTIRAGMGKMWLQKRGNYVPKELSMELGGGWLTKFGLTQVNFDLKFNERTNCMHVEASAKIKAGISIGYREGKVLRAYLAYANEIACEFLHAMGKTGR